MLENNKVKSSQPEQIPLAQKKTYKFRAVTYEVIAHFNSEAGSLYDKIHHLLVSELQKSDAAHIIARGHGGDVK